MSCVLHLISSLGHGGSARQLTWLAPALLGDGPGPRVVVLERPTPWSGELEGAGVPVEHLGWQRLLDAAPLLALRRLLRTLRPAVVQVWGASALRAAALCGVSADRLIVTRALPPLGSPPPLDRGLIRRARKVLALGPTEAGRYRSLGVPEERLILARPGVPPVRPAQRQADEFPERNDNVRSILGIGPLTRYKSFHDAVYALDMLRYLHPGLRLVLVGGGEERDRIETLARGLRAEEVVTFAPPQWGLAPVLGRAECVWAPCRAAAGGYAILEAMAAGRVVVASRLPHVEELIEHGTNGLLYPPGDKMELARETRYLLEDDERHARLREGARRAIGRLDLRELAGLCREAYAKLG